MSWEWINYTYVKSIAFSIVAIVVFYFSFRVFRTALDLLEDKLQVWKGTKISSIKFQKVVFLTENQIVEVLEHVIFAVRWVGYVFITLTCITLTLSFFPDTEELASKVWSGVIDPVEHAIGNIISYIPNLILIGIVIFFTRFVLKGIRFFFTEVERESIKLKGFHQDWARPTYQIIRFLVFIFAFIIILPNLPASGSDAFKGVSVFVGILVSLGSTTAIGNIVAGMVLTYMRPFKVNDFVTIDNTTGLVVEKSLLMTRIKTQKNEEVTIPNLKILSHNIVNYSSSCDKQGVVFHTNISVSYEYPKEKVIEILTNAAKKSDLIEQEPTPFVLQSKFHDFCAVYEVNAHTKHPERMTYIYSELRKNIMDALKENNISMVTPIHYSLEKNLSN